MKTSDRCACPGRLHFPYTMPMQACTGPTSVRFSCFPPPDIEKEIEQQQVLLRRELRLSGVGLCFGIRVSGHFDKSRDRFLGRGDPALLCNETSRIGYEVVYDFTAGASRCKDFRDTFRGQPLDLALRNVPAAYH